MLFYKIAKTEEEEEVERIKNEPNQNCTGKDCRTKKRKPSKLHPNSSSNSSLFLYSQNKRKTVTDPRCNRHLLRGALGASGSINADFSKDSIVARLVVSLAAGAADIAEGAVAALWSVIRELRVRLAVAAAKLNADISSDGANVAGAADEAGNAVGVGGALGSHSAGAEGHRGGNDGRLEEAADHFGCLVVSCCCGW